MTDVRLGALQLLMDIEDGVMLASTNFMVGLCDIAGLPDMKPKLLSILADCPISL